MPVFSKRRRVIAFDNRGAGRTDKPDIPYTIEMMADDAAGLLRTLEVKRADVLGVSMGGRIAMDMAMRYPEMVRGPDTRLDFGAGHEGDQVLPWSEVREGNQADNGERSLRKVPAALPRLHPSARGDCEHTTARNGSAGSEHRPSYCEATETRSRQGTWLRRSARESQGRNWSEFKGGHIFFLCGRTRSSQTAVSEFLD